MDDGVVLVVVVECPDTACQSGPFGWSELAEVDMGYVPPLAALRATERPDAA